MERPRLSTGKVVGLAIHVIHQREVSFGRLAERVDATATGWHFGGISSLVSTAFHLVATCIPVHKFR